MAPPVNKVILAIERIAAAGAPASGGSTGITSFEEIYEQRFNDVSRWVRALGGLDADLDDLTQEVFLVVRRKLGRFDGKNLSAWLYTIAKNEVRDYRRRAWMRRLFLRSELDEAPDDHPPHVQPALDPGEALQRREAQRFVARTLDKMSLTLRTTFVLFEIEGYSGEEIAALEGIPVNTVWTRLHHARKRFFELCDRARAEGKLP
jgi:RNA polymerase sigma-70 factor (ECF subfamily)